MGLKQDFHKKFLTACAAFAFAYAGVTSPAQAFDGERSIKLSALATPKASEQLKSKPSLFGTAEQVSANIKPFTKWTSVLARYQQQMNSPESASYKAWFDRLSHLRDADMTTKMRQINNIVNLNRYVVDSENWGQSDHWATPVEFINRRSGDCEDFAITKMMALKALGVSESKMRIAVVHDMQKDIPHAILIVYHAGEAYVLDNQIPDVISTAQVAHYKPYYSISRTAWWRHGDTTRTASLSSAAR